MRSLPTIYRNNYFRSRTEARHALFMDALGEKWDYETVGFDLDDGDKYMPDFWLPRLNMYLEIKGQEPNPDEIRKARKLQFFTACDVVILHGKPLENDGMLFGWDHSEGGRFTESIVQWDYKDGLLELRSDVFHAPPQLRYAASVASLAQFEYGAQPELAASRALRNIVDYDDIKF